MSYWGRKKGALKRKVKRKILPGYGKSTRQKLGLKRRSSSKRNRSNVSLGDKKLKWQWIFCVLFILMGFYGFSGSFIAGLALLAAGVVLCPLISMNVLYRTIIIIFCLILGGATMPDTEKQEGPSRSASFFDENGERAYYPTTTTATEATTEETSTVITTELATTATTTLTTAAETTTEYTDTTTATETATEPPTTADNGLDYVLNNKSYKYHRPSCSSVKDIADSHKVQYHGTTEDLQSKGYSACGRCF